MLKNPFENTLEYQTSKNDKQWLLPKSAVTHIARQTRLDMT